MKTNLLLGSTLTLIALVIGLVLGSYYYAQVALGSVESGSEYNANNITSTDVGSSSVKTIAGTLGSIVVSSSSVSVVNIYQVSSSTAPTATSSNTLLFSFPAGVDEGTYTYDVGFGGGLLIDVLPGFNGNYVMTYR